MNWIRSFNRDFDALVSLCGARPALVAAGDEERKLSYAELDAVIDRTLAWLRAHGVNQGDTVGAVLPNSMEMLSIFLACMRGGLGFAPLACDTTQNAWGRCRVERKVRPSTRAVRKSTALRRRSSLSVFKRHHRCSEGYRARCGPPLVGWPRLRSTPRR